jgi:hypothetical protein
MESKERFNHEPTGLNEHAYKLQREGYDIEFSETSDLAYEHPERIDIMHDQLSMLGAEYARRVRFQRPLSLAAATLYDASVQTPAALVTTPLKAARKRIERVREEARADLLFDETKMPWHLQRGRALALQTITDAHDLATIEGGEGMYDTMGGRLTSELLSYQFGDNAGWMEGMSLREAMIASGQRFRGKQEAEVSAFADKELDKLETFLTAPVTDEFKEIVAYCYDSLGIRARKELVCAAAEEQLDYYQERHPNKKSVSFLSVGCGTAQSILDVAQSARRRGLDPQVILFDQDPVALAAAMTLAEQMDLGDAVELHCEQLFNSRGESEVAAVLDGRTVDIAEDSGLREYLKPGVYRTLTGAIWQHLNRDGCMITGNMNKGRIQEEFLHGLMGWAPDVRMRTPRQGFELLEASGVPRGSTQAYITQDTVYTVFVSRKSDR